MKGIDFEVSEYGKKSDKTMASSNKMAFIFSGNYANISFCRI